MKGNIQKSGGTGWFLMAKDEGHGFAKKDNVDFQFYAAIAFIKKFLLDKNVTELTDNILRMPVQVKLKLTNINNHEKTILLFNNADFRYANRLQAREYKC